MRTSLVIGSLAVAAFTAAHSLSSHPLSTSSLAQLQKTLAQAQARLKHDKAIAPHNTPLLKRDDAEVRGAQQALAAFEAKSFRPSVSPLDHMPTGAFPPSTQSMDHMDIMPPDERYRLHDRMNIWSSPIKQPGKPKR